MHAGKKPMILSKDQSLQFSSDKINVEFAAFNPIGIIMALSVELSLQDVLSIEREIQITPLTANTAHKKCWILTSQPWLRIP